MNSNSGFVSRLIVIIKKLLVNIVLIFSAVLFSLLLAEIILRVSGFGDIRFAGGENQRFLKGYYTSDNDSGFDIKPDVPPREFRFSDDHFEIWSNNLGCFDEPYKNNEAYTLLVGDSFTWGFTDFTSSFGYTLENNIKKRVLKCGVPSYGTHQELLKAKKIIAQVKTRPEVIIVGYYMGNDILNDYTFPELIVWNGNIVNNQFISDIKTGKINQSDKTKLAAKSDNFKKYCVTWEPSDKGIFTAQCWLKRNSVLYALIQRISKSAPKIYWPYELIWRSEKKEQQWMKQAWDKHLENIRGFKTLADNNDAELLIVLIPSRYQVEKKNRDWMALNGFDLSKAQKRLITFFDDRDIKYIDLTPLFIHCAENNKLYWTFDGHWNAFGNMLAGKYVARLMQSGTNRKLEDFSEFCE